MEIRGEVLGGGGNNCECSPWPTRASNSREAAGGYDAVEEQIAALLLPTTRQFVRSWTCGGADRAGWQPDAPGRWVWVTLRGVGAAAKGALNAKSVHDTFVGKCVSTLRFGGRETLRKQGSASASKFLSDLLSGIAVITAPPTK